MGFTFVGGNYVPFYIAKDGVDDRLQREDQLIAVNGIPIYKECLISSYVLRKSKETIIMPGQLSMVSIFIQQY